MKSREEDRLDGLLTDYAIDHIDWPDSEEELDQFILQTEAKAGTPAGDRSPLLFDIGPVEEKRASGPVDYHDVVRLAYLEVYCGYSIDRLITDPVRNAHFIQACWKLGAQASQYELNHLLFNARKNKIIGKVEGVERYSIPRDEMDKYLFASECALRLLQDQEYFERQRFVSLDRILCDPLLAQRFEDIAREITPGFSSQDYRWAALSIRKGRNRRPTKDELPAPTFERLGRRDSFRASQIDRSAGFFWLDFENADLYIGHAENLRDQVERLLALRWDAVSEVVASLGLGTVRKAEFAVAPYSGVSPSNREALKTQLVRTREPKLNVLEKGLRVA